MKLTNFVVPIVGIICIAYAIKEFKYFKKGWGIKFHFFSDPYYAGEKENASKLEKMNLLIQGIIFLIFGLLCISVTIAQVYVYSITK